MNIDDAKALAVLRKVHGGLTFEGGKELWTAIDYLTNRLAPEARAGDCDAWQRWWDECRICLQNVSTELRSTGRSDARYARLLDSMPATAPRLATIDPRPLTTKATP